MSRPVKKIRVNLRKSVGRYQICYGWNPGKWILTPCTDQGEAVLWAKEREIVYKTTHKTGMPLFGDIARDFYAPGSHFREMKKKKNNTYLESYYTKRIGILNNHILPFFRGLKVDEITPYIIDEWTTKIDRAPDTVNKCIEVLKEVLQPCISKGLLKYNPVNDVEKFHVENEERPPFTKEELERLYPKDLRDAIKIWGSPLYLAWGLVLRDTGCRPSEALAWTWDDYSDEWGGFPIVKRIRGYNGETHHGTKGGKRQYRAAILSDMGNQVIRMVKETASLGRIFPFRVDQGNSFFRYALARVGIPEYIEGSDMPRTQYSLRHSAVTETISIDRDFAKEAFGHRTVKNQQNYDHPDTEELFKRVAKAPEILKKRFG